MDDFTPGDLGFSEAWLVGGPLDGIAYDDSPIFPGGEPATSIAVPLDGITGEAGAFAHYARRPQIWLDGRWYYDYVESTSDSKPAPVEFPIGTTVAGAGSDSPEPLSEAFAPAPRFVYAQAWWIASELCRRRANLRILESWPLDGFYHGLKVGDVETGDHVFMNFLGRTHLHPVGGASAGEPIPWSDALRSESPHEIVKRIESAMRWNMTQANATTPKTLVYRVAAAFLATQLNDRDRWEIGDAYSQGGFVDWPDLLNDFDGCRLALQQDSQASPPASTRVWVVRRGPRVAVLLSELGLLFQRGAAPVDLMASYRERRSIIDPLTIVLSAAVRA